MGTELSHSSAPYSPSNARWMFPDAHTSEPASEPGIVISDEGATAIRSPWHRTDDYRHQDIPQVRDTIPLVHAVMGQQPASGGARMVGAEGEMSVIDRETGKSVPVYGIGQAELRVSQIEANSSVHADASLAIRSLFQYIAMFNRELSTRPGAQAIDPASAYVGEIPTAADIRMDEPYIARLIEQHPEYIQFIGSGIHLHIDAAPEHIARVAHYVRLNAQVMNLPLQAAPFAFGESVPRLGEFYNNSTLKLYDGLPARSVRYLSRLACLDYGGVGIKKAHETLEDALRWSEQRLMRGETNNPARLYGDHADVRIRTDAIDGNRDVTTRLEICAFDTGGYRFETVDAVANMATALVSALEGQLQKGEQGLEVIHGRYASIFGSNPQADAMTEDLYTAEDNNLEIAYNGFDANVIDFKGDRTNARKLFWDLYNFIEQNPGDVPINPRHKSVLKKAAIESSSLAHLMSVPTLQRYYQTGFGTAADWMRARDELLSQKLPACEDDKWRHMADERARALSSHLAQFALAGELPQ